MHICTFRADAPLPATYSACTRHLQGLYPAGSDEGGEGGKLFDGGVLGTDEVEEVGGLDDDVAEVGLGEVVALGIAVDVAKAEVVAALNHEVAEVGVGEFEAEAAGDAVVKLVLDGHVIHVGIVVAVGVGA